jgi:hypothetical protein
MMGEWQQIDRKAKIKIHTHTHTHLPPIRLPKDIKVIFDKLRVGREEGLEELV